MEKTKSVRAQIKGLGIGETVSFPLARIDYVLSCRSRLQVEGRRYSSKRDRSLNIISITREVNADIPQNQ